MSASAPAPTPRAPPLLDITDLEVVFNTDRGAVRAVRGVSLTVTPGETLAVVGESGSGKSVTALAVMGLLPSRSAQVSANTKVFDAQPLPWQDKRAMRAIRGRTIGMVFQDPMTSLNPVLTVGRQLTEIAELHLGMGRAAARRHACDLLGHVGIPSPEARLADYPHQFSGGMRQRVMIAMAIACEPKLLIADEPTTALDVTIQAQILELLARIQEEMGMAIMIVTHDLGVVARIADRVLVMYAGRVVETGPADAVFVDPRMPYTRALLRSVPRLDEPDDTDLVPIRGSPPDVMEDRPQCSFAPRCDLAEPACLNGVPALVATGPDHLAACIKAGVDSGDEK